jgi:hypothetical protein
MLEILAMAGTGVVSLWGYVTARRFTRDRLRFVDAAHVPAAPFVAGSVAALAAGPVVWLLPLVGGITALAFGLGIGLGTAHGSKDVRRALPGMRP